MKNLLLCALGVFLFAYPTFSQPNFTANDIVPQYDTPFRLGINPNFNGSQWTDQMTANLSAGNPDEGVEGVGIKSIRVPLPENFLEFWGYDIRVDAFQHYGEIGLLENTVFLEAPSDDHRDTTHYCATEPSAMFANMYEPIWDDGANGTPVNDENYAALYIYKTVTLYKETVKFWEIWNEPDLDNFGNGWKPQSIDGNWYDNVPDPCEIQMRAPVFHYVRLLRIAYEVIKTIDSEAYVTVGGLGYESFLDVILRYTDNPNGGEVTSEYPLKGGAYFDVLSYHVYPHINGSLKVWDNSINGFTYSRHSDAAVNGTIGLKDKFENILLQYGYDGQTYPKKMFILTETTVPRKKLEDYIGSDAAARNYAMKIQIAGYQNDIRQIALYQLADQNSYDVASNWLEMSGLYEIISGAQPYDVTPNESGIGCKTTSDLIFGKEYDLTLTAEMNLPSNIGGGAFTGGNNNDTTFVIWAKTVTDESEVSSATYTFPASFNFTTVEERRWNFSATNEMTVIAPQNISLTGNPIFFKGVIGGDPINPNVVDLTNTVLIQPNPFNDFFQIKFELENEADVVLEIFNMQGIKVYEWSQEAMAADVHSLLIEDSQYFAAALYIGRISIKGKRPLDFKVLKL